jgi:hypothetical protein
VQCSWMIHTVSSKFFFWKKGFGQSSCNKDSVAQSLQLLASCLQTLSCTSFRFPTFCSTWNDDVKTSLIKQPPHLCTELSSMFQKQNLNSINIRDATTWILPSTGFSDHYLHDHKINCKPPPSAASSSKFAFWYTMNNPQVLYHAFWECPQVTGFPKVKREVNFIMNLTICRAWGAKSNRRFLQVLCN